MKMCNILIFNGKSEYSFLSWKQLSGNLTLTNLSQNLQSSHTCTLYNVPMHPIPLKQNGANQQNINIPEILYQAQNTISQL